jgi:hypothetical protein
LPGNHVYGENPVNATFINGISRDFWIVETVAPPYYELLGGPVRITVTTTTHLQTGENITTVDNQPETDLPFTGGAGTMILIGIALLALFTGTIAFVVDKKRRRDDESLKIAIES